MKFKLNKSIIGSRPESNSYLLMYIARSGNYNTGFAKDFSLNLMIHKRGGSTRLFGSRRELDI